MLNLALETDESERMQSLNLNTGFLGGPDALWQLIVRSSDSLDQLSAEYPEITVKPLLNSYFILTVPQSLIAAITANPQVEYAEKPKRLFFTNNAGRRASCITPLQTAPPSAFLNGVPLNGSGILVAIVDSGIDYAHPDFCSEDGSTRISVLWDQTLDQVFDRQQINEALAQDSETARYALVPSRDISGHGTHVAGICAGNGRASRGLYRGVASEAELIVVKLGTPGENSFPRTTELMEAVDFCLQYAYRQQKPVAINLSFGNNYGSHDGTSLLETYLDDASSFWKNVICVGTGNEGNGRNHASGVLSAEQIRIPFFVDEFETSLSLQLWKSYQDSFLIDLAAPGGQIYGPFTPEEPARRIPVNETNLLIYYGEPGPYSTSQEIYFDFLPVNEFLNAGLWELILTPQDIRSGQYDLWLPSESVLNLGTGFLSPSPDTTLTIPSTARKVISVGAYNSVFDSYAPFSGRGYTRLTNQVKPDLAAPGVNITSCAPGGGYSVKSGTSMAAPFVTGSAALLMEWGILRNRDPYLYGEKVKAYLIKGTKKLPAYTVYPNPQVGWGALCLRDSFPDTFL